MKWSPNIAQCTGFASATSSLRTIPVLRPVLVAVPSFPITLVSVSKVPIKARISFVTVSALEALGDTNPMNLLSALQ